MKDISHKSIAGGKHSGQDRAVDRSPGDVRVEAKKRYGQNFLIDESVVEDIVRGSGIGAEDTVLEIGPGTGVLTGALIDKARRVVAVEIDRDLADLLRTRFAGEERLSIVEGDILKTDLRGLFPCEESIKVVANLPYYITTPIIMYLLGAALPIESITLMVQKEVAERLNAAPGGKDYGALTLSVAYRARVTLIREAGAECFSPRPKVDSAVVRLDMYEAPPVTPADPRYMFSLIRAAFGERRKTLANALQNAPGLALSRERVQGELSRMGLRTDIRGERLSLSEFAELSDRLGGAGKESGGSKDRDEGTASSGGAV